eukprot:IDg19352t1
MPSAATFPGTGVGLLRPTDGAVGVEVTAIPKGAIARYVERAEREATDRKRIGHARKAQDNLAEWWSGA